MALRPYEVEMMEADESDLLKGRKRKPTFADKQAAAQKTMQQRQQFRAGMAGQAIDRFENIQGRHVNLPGGEAERSRYLGASGQTGLVGPPRPTNRDPEMMEANEPKFGRPNPPVSRADELAGAGVSTPAPALPAHQAEMMEARERDGFGPRQPARDQAMLRKRENINRAMIEGQTNRTSVFNPNHPSYNPMRAQMLLDQEDMRLQRADAERAANPPRYALPTEPGQAAKRDELERMFERELIREADAKRPPGEVGPPDLSGVAPRVSEFRGKLEQNAQLDPRAYADRVEATIAQEGRTRDAREQVRFDQGQRDKARTRARTIDELEFNTAVAEQKLRERTAQAAGTRAEADATRAQIEAQGAAADADIAKIVIPAEQERAKAEAVKAATPNWSNAVGTVASAIAQNSGKAPSSASRKVLDDALVQFDGLPPEAQSLAAIEILTQLEQMSPNLSLSKSSLQDSWWRWLNYGPIGPVIEQIFGPVPGVATTVVGAATGADETQTTINTLLQRLRQMRATSSAASTPRTQP